MSGEVVGWAMKQKTGSPAAKLVLAKLADNANEHGLCWPSIDLIVEHTELGQSTVYKHLAALEEMGLLSPVDIAVRGSVQRGFQLMVPGAVGVSDEIPPGGKGKEAIPPGGKVALAAGKSIPPGGTHIDEPSIEPSMNRHSDARPAAREGENMVSIGKGCPQRFPEFRSTVAQTWPNGFPADNLAACEREFTKQTRTHDPDMLIECARIHGQAMIARASTRSASAGKILLSSPSRFLQQGVWKGYVQQAADRRAAESAISAALGRVQRGLGAEMYNLLRDRLGMHENSLAALDGVEFEAGDPALFKVTQHAAKIILESKQFAIQRALGCEIVVQRVAAVKTG